MPTATEQAPDKVETVEIPTGMTGTIKAETDAALKEVQGGGFNDPTFDAELQQAIDKDAGKAPETAAPPKTLTPVVTTEATAQAAELAAKQEELRKLREATEEIPGTLLGDKPKEVKAPDEATAAAERQKFIDEQTKGMTPKAAERFKKIENRAWDAEQKARKIEQESGMSAAELKKQIAELSAKATEKKEPPPETDAMKKRLEELEELVGRTSVADDPRFKARYDGPVEDQIKRIKSVAPADVAEELSELVVMPKSKKVEQRIGELMEGLTELQRSRLNSSIVKIEETLAEKSAQLSKWKENKVHVEAEQIRSREVQQAEQAVKQKVAWSKAMEVITSSDRGLEVFRKLDGNDAWNAKVDARIAAVQKELTGELPGERVVEMAARSVAAEEYRKLFLAQRVLVNRLSEELASLKQVQPDAGDDGGGGGHVEDNRSFVDAAVENTVKAGGLKQ